MPPNRQKSPMTCGKSKSMKDMESDLDAYRRENFDLKMRLHVMEEQLEAWENKGIVSLTQEEDLTSLRVEREKLKCELKEKSEMVLKAGEAVSFLKAQHEKEVQQLVEKYEKQMRGLREKAVVSRSTDFQTDLSAGDSLSHNGEIDKLKQTLEDRERDLAAVKSDFSKATRAMIGFMRANKALHECNEALKFELDNVKSRPCGNFNEVWHRVSGVFWNPHKIHYDCVNSFE